MRKYPTLLLTIFILASCGKGGGNNNDKPSVTTLPATNIATTGATVTGNIVNPGGSQITKTGFQWDTTQNFAVPYDSSLHTTSGNFSITLNNLPNGSIWYVRAYATNNAGTTYGNTVKFITDTIPSNYIVTTIAGDDSAGFANGPALSASFFNPLGVAVAPNGVIYVADGNSPFANGPQYLGYIRQIGTDGTVSNLAQVGHSASDVVVDPSGNIYDIDVNGRLYKITPAGSIDTLTTALGNPICIDMDNTGNFYITLGNSNPNTIAKVTPAGVIKILPLHANKTFIAIGIDRTNNNIYVSDGPNIEKVDTLGNITFIAGGNGTADGTGSSAGFGNSTSEIRVDKNGNLIVADGSTYQVRMVTPAGVVTTIAGNGSPGDQDGLASRANFNGIVGLGLDLQGNIIVTDIGSHKIKRITHK